MSQLVVFDVDGTMIDSFRFYLGAVEIYSRQNGYPVPCLETIKTGYGYPDEHDFKWGCDREEQRRRLMGSYTLAREMLRTECPSVTSPLFEGVAQTLEHLKDLGHTLAIVTSKYEENLLHVLQYHGIARYFDAYRVHEDIARRGEKEKPHPDQLLSVARELRFDPQAVVMIGDTTMDIRMGASAQAQTVGVGWGNHDAATLREAGAAHVIETSFRDIVEALKSLQARPSLLKNRTVADGVFAGLPS